MCVCHDLVIFKVQQVFIDRRKKAAGHIYNEAALKRQKQPERRSQREREKKGRSGPHQTTHIWSNLVISTSEASDSCQGSVNDYVSLLSSHSEEYIGCGIEKCRGNKRDTPGKGVADYGTAGHIARHEHANPVCRHAGQDNCAEGRVRYCLC